MTTELPSKYFYSLLSCLDNLHTWSSLGQPVAAFLEHKPDETNHSDLADCESTLRCAVRCFTSSGQKLYNLAIKEGVLINEESLPDAGHSSRFGERLAVSGVSAAKIERELSVCLMAVASLFVGIEDRITRLTWRLHDAEKRLWPCLAGVTSKNQFSLYGLVRQRMREEFQASGGDTRQLKLIVDHRNIAVHAKHYHPHPVQIRGVGDIVFSTAMNSDQLASLEFPEFYLTQIVQDVNWLLESYVGWWCKRSVDEIQAL